LVFRASLLGLELVRHVGAELVAELGLELLRDAVLLLAVARLVRIGTQLDSPPSGSLVPRPAKKLVNAWR